MKTTKLLIFLAAMTMFAGQAFAGPPPHHGGHHHHHHSCYRGSSGVRLAADIVGLVGVSLDVLRGPVVQPVYTAPVVQPVYTVPAVQPVYTAPVYTVPAPVYTAPVYTVPAAQPVYYRRTYYRY